MLSEIFTETTYVSLVDMLCLFGFSIFYRLLFRVALCFFSALIFFFSFFSEMIPYFRLTKIFSINESFLMKFLILLWDLSSIYCDIRLKALICFTLDYAQCNGDLREKNQ